MNRYFGRIDRRGRRCVVCRCGQGESRLDHRHDLWNYAKEGITWGKVCSGSLQLALCLLTHATGYDSIALKLHQQFCVEYTSTLPKDQDWTISAADIIEWVLMTAAGEWEFQVELDRSPRLDEGGRDE